MHSSRAVAKVLKLLRICPDFHPVEYKNLTQNVSLHVIYSPLQREIFQTLISFEFVDCVLCSSCDIFCSYLFI